MFEIFAGLFDQTLMTLKFTPSEGSSAPKIVTWCVLNTLIRAATLAAFTYGAIRVVITAVSHGPF